MARPEMARLQPTGSFLGRMAESSRRRVVVAQAAHPEAKLRARIARLPPPPPLTLSAQGFDLIAEVKRRSPAAGTLAGSALRIAAQARAYARGGAACLSVLTEPDEFAGDPAHLKEASAAAAPVPTLRKDFLVAPYQLLEARLWGASGVLLIAAILDDTELRRLLRAALALDLFVLVEAFDRHDLRRASIACARAGTAADGRVLVGVNCRDLRSLAIDFGRFAALAPVLPRTLPCVAESGVESVAQIARVRELGYRLALVGTTLMRARDPAAQVATLLEAGRASAEG